MVWPCWWFALQYVGGCCALLCFKPADDACPLLSSMWVTAVCVSSMLMMPVLWSPGCEWLLCLAVFQACWWCCPLLSRKWVAAVPCCVSSLLMMPVLCLPGCEWLLCLVVFQACWWCLSSVLQNVSGSSALLCSKPADDACPLLSSLWVATVPFCVFSLLKMPLLCSPGSKLLLCLAAFHACWWPLFLAL